MDMLDIWINMGMTAILMSIKNEARRASLKKAMLKLRNAINTAYINDPDFNS